MIRFAKVVAVDKTKAMARVEIEDADRAITYWLPIMQHKTKDDKFYWLPDVGEQVVVAFYQDDWDTGIILGSCYNQQDLPPASEDKFIIKFKNGSYIEHDRQTGNIKIKATGNIQIEADGDVIIKGRFIDLNP